MPHRSSPRRSWALARLLAVAAVVALGAGCGKAPSAQSSAKAPAAPLQAEVLTIAPTVWPTIVRTQGNLVADEVAVVGTKVAGRIEAIHVDLGDVVREGDPLATIDQDEYQLQVAQTEAQHAQSLAAVGLTPDDPVEKLNKFNAPPVRQEKAIWDEAVEKHRRAVALRQRNAVSEAELEQLAAAERVAGARYSSALNGVEEKIALIRVRAAELAMARQRLKDSVIRAPFDGLVQQRQVAPGTFVAIGDAISTVVRSNPLRYRGMMPERHAQQLAIGQRVTVQIESFPQPRVVKVTRISPALNELSRSLMFEAVVENPDRKLRTGLFAEGEVVLNAEARSIVIPRTALVEFAGAEKVWKLVDGSAREQSVRTGLRRPEGIEIVEGLAEGDQILVDGSKGRVAKVEPVFRERPEQQTASSRDATKPADGETTSEPVSE